jgi:hypothetical protein
MLIFSPVHTLVGAKPTTMLLVLYSGGEVEFVTENYDNCEILNYIRDCRKSPDGAFWLFLYLVISTTYRS